MEQITFDYIIIGAGSAGCVLANRLSANPKNRVCLIEAGGHDRDLRVKVPAGILALYGNPRFDYNYVGVPQPHLANRSIPVNRGKALGGSSSINSMIYMRGAAQDYDEWASLNCKGWSFKDVLPVFKGLEKNLLEQDEKFHGFDGELLVDVPQDPNILSSMWVNAGMSVGLPKNQDFNAESQLGLGIYNVTQDKGQRFSSYTAFVKPVENRENLTILTNSEVEKLTMTEGKVSSVEVKRNNQIKSIHCRSEVILSAGAIGTPRILLSSGIGPADELSNLDIPCISDVKGVGKNLRDHVDGMITVRSKSTKTLGLSLSNLPSMVASPFQYLFSRKGMLSTNYVEAGGFAKTKYADDLADIQFHFVPGYRSHRGKLVEYGHGYAVHTCVLRPKSIGEITLKKNRSQNDILIDHRFFSDEYDAKVLVEGIKIARSILEASEFDEIRGPEMLPGSHVQSDDEILDYLKKEALTVYHPVGTAKMGTDDMAVVHPDNLKVKGVENLRVADASIMPTLIAGNTNAPSMMIGQMAANMILS
ncbi:MAG: GMC family oxidoreductase N-terminal domain-containing protein [Methylocystaceae bacterium]|nr:GMC family oxidoreductase N-terminal domain-containing protein [Methylocystaceae bacterium]